MVDLLIKRYFIQIVQLFCKLFFTSIKVGEQETSLNEDSIMGDLVSSAEKQRSKKLSLILRVNMLKYPKTIS